MTVCRSWQAAYGSGLMGLLVGGFLISLKQVFLLAA
jgi:hypothetical protein